MDPYQGRDQRGIGNIPLFSYSVVWRSWESHGPGNLWCCPTSARTCSLLIHLCYACIRCLYYRDKPLTSEKYWLQLTLSEFDICIIGVYYYVVSKPSAGSGTSTATLVNRNPSFIPHSATHSSHRHIYEQNIYSIGQLLHFFDFDIYLIQTNDLKQPLMPNSKNVHVSCATSEKLSALIN